MTELKKFSKGEGKKKVWVPDPNAKQRAAFPSNFSALRRDLKDNFCYRIPPLVSGKDGNEVPMPRQILKKKKEKAGRLNHSIPEAYAVIVPGQPDIDAGVEGWIIPEDTDEFVIRGNRMDSLLETFSRVGSDIVYETDNFGKRVEAGRIPRVKNWRAESSKLEEQGSGGAARIKTDATTISMRDTVGVSPGISRALQRMIEDGFVEEARMAAEAAMEPFGRIYEEIFRGPKTNAKVTSMVGHASLLPNEPAGHFHFDNWINSTYLSEAETGVDRDVVPVRCWDPKATCHYGPGPGVTFWTRHLDILGDLTELAKVEPEAARRAGYTKMLCEQALSSCRKRSEKAYEKALKERAKIEASGGIYTDWIRPPDDFARDVRIHREIDRIFSEAIRGLGLEKDYVSIGQQEYKEHLIEAYKVGDTGIRMATPEDLEQVAKMARRAEERARQDREAAEQALESARLEKTVATQLWADAASLRAGIDEDALSAKQFLAEALKAKEEAIAARDEAVAEAQLAAEPILSAVREREAKLPAKETAAELRGFQRVFFKLFPNEKPTAADVQAAEKELDASVAKIRSTAEVRAWSRVLSFLGKNNVAKNATAESLANDAEKAIAGRLTNMISGVFRIFGREVSERIETPDAVDAALIEACNDFKADARREGLTLAVSKIRNMEVSELVGMDEAGLTAEIEAESVKLRAGLAAQKKTVLIGLTRVVFGKTLGNFLIKLSNSEAELKEVLKVEFLRRGEADAALEKALPTLEAHAPIIAAAARKIINSRPQIPESEKEAAIKTVNGEKPAGSDEPDI